MQPHTIHPIHQPQAPEPSTIDTRVKRAQSIFTVRTGLLALPVLLLSVSTAALGQAETDGVTALDDVSVTSSSETATSPIIGYSAQRSATGTKTDTPLIETPTSVQVIPRDLIEQQQAIQLKDVYENVSGVQQAGNTLNAQSEVLPIIRGFESPTLLRNGLRATAAGAVDLINIERVEVLKGPASILYGALEPGGIINYVTKRPLAETHHQVGIELGSESFLRASLDSTGPINTGGTWMYRVNAALTDSESFRDEIELTRTTVAPSFLWTPGKNTELLLDFAYTAESQPYDSGIPISGEGEPLVADSTFFGDPDLNGRENDDYYASYQLTHQINPVWQLRNQVQFHRADNRNESLRNRGVRNEDTEIRQRYQHEDRVEDETQFVLDGIATFNTGDTKHTLLVGAEVIQQETDWQRYRENLDNVVISNNPAVDFDPPADQTFSDEPASTDWYGIYVQDQMSMLEDGRLKLLVGVRYDDVKTNRSRNGTASPEVKDDAITARAGLLYQFNDQHSAYISASQSFQPQFPGTVDRDGNSLDPETGNQIEVGYKNALLNGKLISTVSVYRIEKDDVAVWDQAYFDEVGEAAYFPGVKQRSQGLEIDVAGQLTPQLKLLANYSYTDTEVLENQGDPSQEGEPIGGVSENLARLWLTYDFAGPLQGVGISGGIRHVGQSSVQFSPEITLDSYTLADAALWYSWKNWRASVKVNNLLDEEYIARA